MQAHRYSRVWLWGLAGSLLILIGLVIFVQAGGLRRQGIAPIPDYWPTDGWRRSDPEGQGFSSAALAAGLQRLQENNTAIDSLLIIREGYLVLDASFEPYDGSFPHDMASIAKSVTTTLVAIAAEQGKIDLDRPMQSYLPDRTIANMDERKEQITVRHLTSMRNGMESGCLDGDESTLSAMRSQPDWVQAALDRPMVSEPGTRFCYDSPGMHILSAILQESTGMTEAEFAALYLFEPLGIRDAAWESDPQGYTQGWGNLHLKPADAAKLGYLWLNGGVWDGQQIVPESWIHDSVRPQSRNIGVEFGYGYGWWVSPIDYYALGRGGQFVRVIPARNLVMVATGGNYDFGEVEAFLVPSLIGLKDHEPADPAGLARLEAVVAGLAQAPEPYLAAVLPGTAMEISGHVYSCESNPGDVESLRFEFGDEKTGTLFVRQYGMETALPRGLDGSYQVSPQGQAQRGYWEDPKTFNLEVFDIGVLARRFTFRETGCRYRSMKSQ
jgi:CubicO group peptidase (beta-lactamase class C family)